MRSPVARCPACGWLVWRSRLEEHVREDARRAACELEQALLAQAWVAERAARAMAAAVSHSVSHPSPAGADYSGPERPGGGGE